MWGLALILFGFVFWRVILPLDWKWPWKAAAAGLAAIGVFKFHLFRLFGGPNFFAPELPVWLLLAGSWYYSAMLIFCLLLIVAELLLTMLFFTSMKEKMRCRIANYVHLGLLLASLGLASYGLYQGRKLPELHEETVLLTGLPPEAEGIRIAVLTDLHADHISDAARTAEIVRRVNALRPDAVLILGDNIDLPVSDGGALAPLANLSSRYGIFGIPGNHEYYWNYPAWRSQLQKLGIRMLDNESVRLLPGVRLAGVTDPAAKRQKLPGPDLEAALALCRREDTVILLCHRPGPANEAARRGIDLMLSGHTHGGLFPGFKWLIGRFNGGFSSGWYQVGKMQLRVSNGTGIWNGVALRINCPAEILLLTLRRR